MGQRLRGHLRGAHLRLRADGDRQRDRERAALASKLPTRRPRPRALDCVNRTCSCQDRLQEAGLLTGMIAPRILICLTLICVASISAMPGRVPIDGTRQSKVNGTGGASYVRVSLLFAK